jgi:hypothetical protein
VKILYPHEEPRVGLAEKRERPRRRTALPLAPSAQGLDVLGRSALALVAKVQRDVGQDRRQEP